MSARLEDLKSGARVPGLTPDGTVELVAATWVGSDTLPSIFQVDEVRLSLPEAERNWSFETDGDLLRLVTEASHNPHIKKDPECRT